MNNHPIDDKELLKEPYISFNKLFGVKSLTKYLYPICAIVKAVEMFKEELTWYSCEGNKIYLSKFFWYKNRIKENTLYLEKTEYEEWINNNEYISIST